VAAARRTRRGERRRSLGQNFLREDLADRLVAGADFRAGDFALEIGPGLGPFTRALLRRGVDVLAVEADPLFADRLRARDPGGRSGSLRVVAADFRSLALPSRPFRVVGSLPFGQTTDILRRLLDEPSVPLLRADLVVQWEVARKRASAPSSTLLSATWAPWWDFRLGQRIPAREFRPVPRVDAGVLIVTRRQPALLPVSMAARYARFVRAHWPFPDRSGGASRACSPRARRSGGRR
jgi:23S rRNA (adenine-N6)-dimethyltransferase